MQLILIRYLSNHIDADCLPRYNGSRKGERKVDRKIISKIVKASGVHAGELVLVHFWGEDQDKEIANRFMTAVAAQGAAPFLVQQSRTVNRNIFACAHENSFDERYFDLFSQFDAVLDVFAYQPVKLGYELPDEQMTVYRRYMAQIFQKLVKCKRFAQIRIPTQANAEESGLNAEDYIRRMTRAYDIDYDVVAKACKEEVERFAGVRKVSVHTANENVLSMELTGRNWQIDAGDGDLPCGEIYIAPLEESAQGSVFFDTFYLEGESYKNVVLTIESGKICGSSNEAVKRFFENQPEENRVVCEFGIGMNPNITDLCGYTVLDEKMAGTFHIAVGANELFGGKNKASIHEDFVGHGRIEVEK